MTTVSTNPLLSIVTGTFNRLDYLRAMIQSARDQMPVGMDYEFVVVDGGSTDGTLEWLRGQGDISVIAHGKLLGAIVAFCDGARAAHGDYVLLANDDILFHDGGILRALAHLETHPLCGGVAFMDNRPAPGYEQGYKVQFIPATTPEGRSVSVPYAQVGLFRRALGDIAGWWGDKDPIMAESRTYGGDNYLSARIWEMGYTIDAVEGCAIDDRLPQDELRAQNVAHDLPMVSPYHRRFPNGVPIGSKRLEGIDIPAPERLRILYLPLFSPGYGRYKVGLCDALSRVGLTFELDYVRNRSRFIGAVRDFRPHVILTQLHDANTITAAMLEQARALVPGVVIVNWNGDVYADQLTAPDMLDLLKQVDLQTVVNADVLPVYAEHDIQASYWQIGYEPVPDALPAASAHDLLFMANAYSPARKALGAFLRGIDANAGLYGYGWDELGGSGNSFYNFAAGAALYRACKIAISDNQYRDKGFVSNRLFEALANGAFVMQQTVPGLEELTGLVDGVHYVRWTDFDDLRAQIELYLSDADERRQIAAAGEAFAREHFSFDARVKELFETLLPAIRQPSAGELMEAAIANYSWIDSEVREETV